MRDPLYEHVPNSTVASCARRACKNGTLADRLFEDMVRMNHPRWSMRELDGFMEWRRSNTPRVWDHFVRLWLTLIGRRDGRVCRVCGRVDCPHE